MAVVAKLPKAYQEEEEERATAPPGPAHYVSLEYAEPSPTWIAIQKIAGLLRKLFVYLIIAGVIGIYPALMVSESRIYDEPVLAAETQWAVPHVGVAITKIARETEGTGLAADRPRWHPQARLTALPAWQAESAAALGEHVLLLAAFSGGEAGEDGDLSAAARLLTAAATPGAELRPRLVSAAEALNLYNARVHRAEAVAPDPDAVLPGELSLFMSWAESSRREMSDRVAAEPAGWWLASGEDVRAVYRAKARAHAALELFRVSRLSAPALRANTETIIAAERVEAAWRRAAEFKPLFVSRRAGNGRFLPNHPAAMGFFLSEAESAMAELNAQLESVRATQGVLMEEAALHAAAPLN
jgi:hypothetical protein